mgnify:FL=1
MKKLLLTLTMFLLAGCLATENRKVAITHRQPDGTVAPVDTVTCWWRIPYYEDRENHPMDRFIPREDLPDHLHSLDSVDRDLLHFSENAIRWPKKMREPYRPAPVWVTPAPPKKENSSLKRRLEQPILPKTQPEGELY